MLYLFFKKVKGTNRMEMESKRTDLNVKGSKHN